MNDIIDIVSKPKMGLAPLEPFETQNIEPIQKLFNDLNDELRRDPNGANVTKLMRDYLDRYDDWKSYMHFNNFKYARNLINANEILELMVICWLPDQCSPIHNHAGQHCWAACLEGNVSETHYIFSETKTAFGTGPLEEGSSHHVSEKEISYITDDIALHLLKPLGGKRAATLHLYSKPISECNIYCPRTGMITKRKPGFYTINKQIQPGEIQNCSPVCPQ